MILSGRPLSERLNMNTPVTRRSSRFVRWLFLVLMAVGVSSASLAATSVFVSVGIAPPPIPVYEQPACPGPGYIWVPGYWAWAADGGYYWVPGYWSPAPFVGALWTPGWWGWSGAVYVWHPGYWGTRVGFYGGIDYGFGYFGIGYVGGYWNNGAFFYNTAVNNVNVTVVNNTFNQVVVDPNPATRVSFNGGQGGITTQPTAEERLAERERHTAPTAMQVQHERMARSDPAQRASVNHGQPGVTATPMVAGLKEGGRAAATAPAPEHTQRRAQSARPETHAQHAAPSQGTAATHRGSAQTQREAKVEHRAAHPSAPPAQREARVEHRAAQPSAPPVQREARAEHRAMEPSAPPVQREPRVERRAPPPTSATPPRESMHPETHAQAPAPNEHRAERPGG